MKNKRKGLSMSERESKQFKKKRNEKAIALALTGGIVLGTLPNGVTYAEVNAIENFRNVISSESVGNYDGMLKSAISMSLSGSGTSSSPYMIESVDDLVAFADSVNAGKSYSREYIRLSQDIDLSGISNWVPIGDITNNFKGIFDGNGHTISNLKITGDSSYSGLFGYVVGTVKNLNLSRVKISKSDGDNVGSIAGYLQGTISNCSSQGSLEADTRSKSVGGIVGYVYQNSKVEKCFTNMEITGYSDLGGIVGVGVMSSSSADDIVIDQCYSIGNLYSDSGLHVGGILGNSSCTYPGTYVNVSNSYSTMNITKKGYTSGTVRYVGGIAAGSSRVTVSNCYYSGKFTGVGSGSGTPVTAPFASSSDVKISNCYYDSSVFGGTVSNYGIPLITSDMSGSKAKDNMKGFDFDIIWSISKGYPVLSCSLVQDSREVLGSVTLSDFSTVNIVKDSEGNVKLSQLKDNVITDKSDLDLSSLSSITNTSEGFSLEYVNSIGVLMRAKYDNDCNLLSELAVDIREVLMSIELKSGVVVDAIRKEGSTDEVILRENKSEVLTDKQDLGKVELYEMEATSDGGYTVMFEYSNGCIARNKYNKDSKFLYQTIISGELPKEDPDVEETRTTFGTITLNDGRVINAIDGGTGQLILSQIKDNEIKDMTSLVNVKYVDMAKTDDGGYHITVIKDKDNLKYKMKFNKESVFVDEELVGVQMPTLPDVNINITINGSTTTITTPSGDVTLPDFTPSDSTTSDKTGNTVISGSDSKGDESIVVVTPSGDVISSESLTDSYTESRALSYLELSNGNFVVAGSATDTIESPIAEGAVAKAVDFLEGLFVDDAYADSTLKDGLMVEFSADGARLSEKVIPASYGAGGDATIYEMTELANGDIQISGKTLGSTLVNAPTYSDTRTLVDSVKLPNGTTTSVVKETASDFAVKTSTDIYEYDVTKYANVKNVSLVEGTNNDVIIKVDNNDGTTSLDKVDTSDNSVTQGGVIKDADGNAITDISDVVVNADGSISVTTPSGDVSVNVPGVSAPSTGGDSTVPPTDDSTTPDSPTTPPTDGSTDGSGDGSTDDSTTPPTDGSTDGSGDGSTDGSGDGSNDDSTDGSSPNVKPQTVIFDKSNPTDVVIEGIVLNGTDIDYITVDGVKVDVNGIVRDVALLALTGPAYEVVDGQLVLSAEIIKELDLDVKEGYVVEVAFADGTILSDKISLNVIDSSIAGEDDSVDGDNSTDEDGSVDEVVPPSEDGGNSNGGNSNGGNSNGGNSNGEENGNGSEQDGPSSDDSGKPETDEGNDSNSSTGDVTDGSQGNESGSNGTGDAEEEKGEVDNDKSTIEVKPNEDNSKEDETSNAVGSLPNTGAPINVGVLGTIITSLGVLFTRKRK